LIVWFTNSVCSKLTILTLAFVINHSLNQSVNLIEAAWPVLGNRSFQSFSVDVNLLRNYFFVILICLSNLSLTAQSFGGFIKEVKQDPCRDSCFSLQCNLITYITADILLCHRRYRLVISVLFTRSACAVSSRGIHMRLSGSLVR